MNKYLILILVVFVFNSCGSSKVETKQKQPLAKHVILIGSDGFGAYAFEKAKIPTIRKMMNAGAYSLKARSVLPSSSAVNWASILMGSGSELHGYTEWGSKVPELPSRVLGEEGIYPTIFSLINNQMPNAKMGVSYTWGGIGSLFEKKLVDLDFNGKEDPETIEKALNFIVDEKPVFTFIHLTHPDNEGHEVGHDTPAYYAAVEKVDDLVANLLKKLEKEKMMDDTIIIFTSDHGGIGKGHGGKTLLEVEIPWIIYGKGVKTQGALNTSIVTYDTGATIAHILGLNIPQFWTGRPVLDAF
ncbi:alkaline phosphatase [Polaribacter sp. IC073]|uniref:alkaline phosphatase n=1 Tax=Polaribacter sp. IC073 TaxID=2508540 RepID=UPI0011BE673C|nr:alkaline phosphatase [Polaribacter sp. IC073]TXD46782.1 alkaline phosphatase [Polaribacter sp. IC073]